MKYIFEITTFLAWPVMVWFSFFLSRRVIRRYDQKHSHKED